MGLLLLSVPQNDVEVPSRRSQTTAPRALILTGLTYEEILAGQPVVNSALFVIPEWSDAYGLQIKTRRQGKAHLAPNEQAFTGGGAHVTLGIPALPVVDRLSVVECGRYPARLAHGSVCYDAMDLGRPCSRSFESVHDESAIRPIWAIGLPRIEDGPLEARRH